ncbi:disease resistance protein RPH8A-like isoform X2 [Magnolia sinica]|uniref:disease resistance protein RPH8A-like isoform X2 n=1 Tax=Magnolia sinica TaxID=86752 RepID=UPI0026594BC2|nr:disease resistance protein RPH8A-like isoform X2 [Magnolia sinica]
MGGLGKTTLTRKVYNHYDVKKHFDCCAWIYVSQEYDARDLLQRIMGCFLIHTGREMDEMQMRESIFEHLKHKRYFVVVDDIWKTEAWVALAAAFPDMNNGSRVILTTRNRDVALSYEDLPYYLKPCFLYLGVYPEDHKFSAKELIRLWVAEGFVHSEGAKTLEEVGEDCLEELIQRSLIQIVERSLIGGVKSCGIHDLLRDLSLLKAKEENFLNINTGGARYFSPKARRLAMHHGDSVNASLSDFPLNLRSIIWFSSEQYLRQNQQKLIFGGFRLLRVLHLSQRGTRIEAEKVPKEIGTLVHLRYLEMTVNVNGTGQSLPSSMANLRNLQTLVVRFTFFRQSVHIPIDIWNMQQLRHVRVREGAFTCEGSTLGEQTADELSLPSNLQTLRNILAGDWIENYLQKLINLRTLKIEKVDSSRHGEGLIDSIPKLDHLRSLKLTGKDLIPFPPILNLLYLFKLHLNGRLGNLPESHEFSPNLTKLTLYASKLKQEPIMTLEKLANLRVLRLEYYSYLGKEMVCSRQGFPRLEFLVFRGLFGLEEWRVEEGAMLRLSRLKMHGAYKLKMLPEGLQHVTTLKKLEIAAMSHSFTNRLRKDEGEDWYKIQHIPSITIYPSY